MRIKRIHVNQHVVKANAKTGAREPALTVKVGRENHRAHEVEIMGPSKLVYRPDCPLACGARVWIETTETVAFWRGGERIEV